MVEFYTEEFLWGFLHCGFPKENLCVLCVIVLVVLLVILRVKKKINISSKQLIKLNTSNSIGVGRYEVLEWPCQIVRSALLGIYSSTREKLLKIV